MKKFETLLTENQNQVFTITLHRPEVHNAFNEVLIRELTEAVQEASKNKEIRAIVITGIGNTFCAGGDLNWMKKSATYTREENIEDAKKLHQMLLSIHHAPQPVLAKVNGPAFGGGVGLTAACDLSFAYKTALFSLSEVRLGLAPAVISPFVIRKIGLNRFREYSLTAERFSAMQAKEMGLVQHCGSPEEIDELIEAKIQMIKMGGPEALAQTKVLIEEVSSSSMEKAGEITGKFLADRRASAEGQEGITAFFEKRKAKWVS
ncbi:MAG: enoyl-CoA hydratase/isomerase family protein [Deltaproteobacteria bacterium]|nr:enoyl-CoA hydratase/isomerase family protein [Deltaproteobacteria bacterium]